MGNFVVTKDNEKPIHWKEYRLSDFGFKYGVFSISSNSEVEMFLTEKAREAGILDEIEAINVEGVTHMPIADVSPSAIKSLKQSIRLVNQKIATFNKQNEALKKEFTSIKKNELSALDTIAHTMIGQMRERTAELKKELKALQNSQNLINNTCRLKKHEVRCLK